MSENVNVRKERTVTAPFVKIMQFTHRLIRNIKARRHLGFVTYHLLLYAALDTSAFCNKGLIRYSRIKCRG